MSPWMKELMLVAEAEYHARRVVATLATADAAGQPHARTVIVRKLDTIQDSVWITSDSRSDKFQHLTANPIAELLFWLPHERQQFRLRCRAEIVSSGAERDEQWADLHDTNRALFFWPAPGVQRQEGDDFVVSIVDSTPPPSNFLVLVFRPFEAETLELNEHPHLRRRWRAENGWQLEQINP